MTLSDCGHDVLTKKIGALSDRIEEYKELNRELLAAMQYQRKQLEALDETVHTLEIRVAQLKAETRCKKKREWW